MSMSLAAESTIDESVAALLAETAQIRRRLGDIERDYERRIAATEEWRGQVTEWLTWEHAQLGKLLAVLAAIGGAAGDVQVGRLPEPPAWPLSDS